MNMSQKVVVVKKIATSFPVRGHTDSGQSRRARSTFSALQCCQFPLQGASSSSSAGVGKQRALLFLDIDETLIVPDGFGFNFATPIGRRFVQHLMSAQESVVQDPKHKDFLVEPGGDADVNGTAGAQIDRYGRAYVRSVGPANGLGEGSFFGSGVSVENAAGPAGGAESGSFSAAALQTLLARSEAEGRATLARLQSPGSPRKRPLTSGIDDVQVFVGGDHQLSSSPRTAVLQGLLLGHDGSDGVDGPDSAGFVPVDLGALGVLAPARLASLPSPTHSAQHGEPSGMRTLGEHTISGTTGFPGNNSPKLLPSPSPPHRSNGTGPAPPQEVVPLTRTSSSHNTSLRPLHHTTGGPRQRLYPAVKLKQEMSRRYYSLPLRFVDPACERYVKKWREKAVKVFGLTSRDLRTPRSGMLLNRLKEHLWLEFDRVDTLGAIEHSGEFSEQDGVFFTAERSKGGAMRTVAHRVLGDLMRPAGRGVVLGGGIVGSSRMLSGGEAGALSGGVVHRNSIGHRRASWSTSPSSGIVGDARWGRGPRSPSRIVDGGIEDRGRRSSRGPLPEQEPPARSRSPRRVSPRTGTTRIESITEVRSSSINTSSGIPPPASVSPPAPPIPTARSGGRIRDPNFQALSFFRRQYGIPEAPGAGETVDYAPLERRLRQENGNDDLQEEEEEDSDGNPRLSTVATTIPRSGSWVTDMSDRSTPPIGMMLHQLDGALAPPGASSVPVPAPGRSSSGGGRAPASNDTHTHSSSRAGGSASAPVPPPVGGGAAPTPGATSSSPGATTTSSPSPRRSPRLAAKQRVSFPGLEHYMGGTGTDPSSPAFTLHVVLLDDSFHKLESVAEFFADHRRKKVMRQVEREERAMISSSSVRRHGSARAASSSRDRRSSSAEAIRIEYHLVHYVGAAILEPNLESLSEELADIMDVLDGGGRAGLQDVRM